jgi:hypothetical protein
VEGICGKKFVIRNPETPISPGYNLKWKKTLLASGDQLSFSSFPEMLFKEGEGESLSSTYSRPMTKKKQILKGPGQLWSFLAKVLRDFKRNQGMLLSGAVAYYTLLSIVPASILALIVLPHFVNEEQLFQTLSTYLELVIPGYTATLTKEVRGFGIVQSVYTHRQRMSENLKHSAPLHHEKCCT